MHVRYYGALPRHNFCMWQWTNNEDGSGIWLQWITSCAWFWVKCIKQFDCAARCWSQTMPPRFRLEHCVTHDWYNFAWKKYPYMIWILTKLLLISKPHINEPHSQNLSSWRGMLLTWMKFMWMIFFSEKLAKCSSQHDALQQNVSLAVYLLHELRHNDMKTFSTLLALCVEIHQSPGDYPHRGSVIWSTNVFFVVCQHTVEQIVKLWWFGAPWHSHAITVKECWKDLWTRFLISCSE